jgi:hypothetical protein
MSHSLQSGAVFINNKMQKRIQPSVFINGKGAKLPRGKYKGKKNYPKD